MMKKHFLILLAIILYNSCSDTVDKTQANINPDDDGLTRAADLAGSWSYGCLYTNHNSMSLVIYDTFTDDLEYVTEFVYYRDKDCTLPVAKYTHRGSYVIVGPNEATDFTLGTPVAIDYTLNELSSHGSKLLLPLLESPTAVNNTYYSSIFYHADSNRVFACGWASVPEERTAIMSVVYEQTEEVPSVADTDPATVTVTPESLTGSWREDCYHHEDTDHYYEEVYSYTNTPVSSSYSMGLEVNVYDNDTCDGSSLVQVVYDGSYTLGAEVDVTEPTAKAVNLDYILTSRNVFGDSALADAISNRPLDTTHFVNVNVDEQYNLLFRSSWVVVEGDRVGKLSRIGVNDVQ